MSLTRDRGSFYKHDLNSTGTFLKGGGGGEGEGEKEVESSGGAEQSKGRGRKSLEGGGCKSITKNKGDPSPGAELRASF